MIEASGVRAYLKRSDTLVHLVRWARRTQRPSPPGGVEVGPLVAIPSPQLSFDSPDALANLFATPEFAEATRFFATTPSVGRALVSPNSQALLFSLIRHFKPLHVVEIGTFKASTTEALARALQLNGAGIVHSIDPFGADRVPPILAGWPAALRAHLDFRVVDSMMFFAAVVSEGWQAGLIFVDGNHDYEFALFDIASAARRLAPGGFLVVDNISQPGPFLALRDFKTLNPRWEELGRPVTEYRGEWPFDPNRTGIVNTDFAILRAPQALSIGGRPVSVGDVPVGDASFHGLTLQLDGPAEGTLRCQAILRTFTTSAQTEQAFESRIELQQAAGDVRVSFEGVAGRPEDGRQTVEIWLQFDGARELLLKGVPLLTD